MDYTVTPHSVRRESAEQLEFLVSSGDCLPLWREAIWVLFWPLVFPVTVSIKEWNPMCTSQLNSSLEIWREGWGGGFVTERTKTENSRLYCQSRFRYFVFPNQKHIFNCNNTEISHKTAFPKLCSAGSPVFHDMSVCVP